MNKTEEFVMERLQDIMDALMITLVFFLSPLWLPVYLYKRRPWKI